VTQLLLDPHTVHAQGRFKNEQDLAISAHNSYLLVYDNLSNITAAESDALCRMATGSGFRTRKLYTDTDEILIQVARPILLNGIVNLVERSDLADRTLQISLSKLELREDERNFWAEFEQVRPVILGALYSAVSAALRRRESVEINTDVRMLDAFKFAVAAEPELDCPVGAVSSAILTNRKNQNRDLINGDPLTDAIRQAVITKAKSDSWLVSAKQLRSFLQNRFVDLKVPTPAELGKHLQRVQALLQSEGIQFDRTGRTNQGVKYKFSVGSV
jgi:putative DNA primase/helicase